MCVNESMQEAEVRKVQELGVMCDTSKHSAGVKGTSISIWLGDSGAVQSHVK